MKLVIGGILNFREILYVRWFGMYFCYANLDYHKSNTAFAKGGSLMVENSIKKLYAVSIAVNKQSVIKSDLAD